jgi:hypothetical protein
MCIYLQVLLPHGLHEQQVLSEDTWRLFRDAQQSALHLSYSLNGSCDFDDQQTLIPLCCTQHNVNHILIIIIPDISEVKGIREKR